MERETIRAAAWGAAFTVVLGLLIVAGSRGLEHFDAALVGYTFLTPRFAGRNAAQFSRRLVLEFAANRFIFRRSALRGTAHWLIMWSCIVAAAITFPLVWAWIEFRTVPGGFDRYCAYVFGFPTADFVIE